MTRTPGALGVDLTGEQLTELQVRASRHVAFGLTEACPLRCSHCIVATVSAVETSRTMSDSRANAYATGMPGLRARGVEAVSFTGGEPLLAGELLSRLSRAAVDAGMRCTVVTACHWAGTEAAALRTVDRFPAVTEWHLSSDLFHEKWIPRDFVVNAARAVVARGRRAVIRMAAATPVSEAHEALRCSLEGQVPAEVPVLVQPVTRSGRATDVAATVPTADVPAWPCTPNGMVVRWDGTVAPCCAGLVDQRDGHPFALPGADGPGGPADAHAAWVADPLLQLIRAVGFAPLLQWTEEIFPDHPVLTATPRHPCECCLALWRRPGVGAALRARAEAAPNRAKIARLTQVVFGESPRPSAESPR